MLALRVAIDGRHAATVSTEGLTMLSFSIHGTRTDGHLAHVYLSGGNYPETGSSTHLIWLDEANLKHGQVVSVALVADALTSHPGRTIEDMFPDDEAIDGASGKSTEQLFAELRRKSLSRTGYSFRLQGLNGMRFEGTTAEEEHGFGLGVLWNSFYPERVHLSLHSYTLDSLEHREPGRYLVQETLTVGDSLSFELVADQQPAIKTAGPK